MRLRMFEIMDDTVALLNKRQDYYQTCAYELQSLIRESLGSEALIGVNVRVKSEKSLREKILRKRLYLAYDNNYELLNNLSDLIGLRAECRFLREEAILYEKLLALCTQRHGDGSFSIPAHPNVRFHLSASQPEAQQNGLAIYRIDGKYHKNGVSAPFELQIKALANVFWSEVEHQLVYKNHSYALMDGFMKQLLYSNYDSLKQLDFHLQMIFDQIRLGAPNATRLPSEPQNEHMRSLLAKLLSDVFLRHMRDQMGFSFRLGDACEILAQYLLTRAREEQASLQQLIAQVRAVAEAQDFAFEEQLELDGAYYSEDPFCGAMGCYLTQQLNLDYEWNVFFRMLFTLRPGSRLSAFSEYIGYFRARFTEDTHYSGLPEDGREATRAYVLAQLPEVLIARGDISMLYEDTIAAMQGGIRLVCERGAVCTDDVKACLQEAASGL